MVFCTHVINVRTFIPQITEPTVMRKKYNYRRLIFTIAKNQKRKTILKIKMQITSWQSIQQYRKTIRSVEKREGRSIISTVLTLDWPWKIIMIGSSLVGELSVRCLPAITFSWDPSIQRRRWIWKRWCLHPPPHNSDPVVCIYPQPVHSIEMFSVSTIINGCMYLDDEIVILLTFTPVSEPSFLKSSNFITSAIIKPFSKSVWILPAACGAFDPF